MVEHPPQVRKLPLLRENYCQMSVKKKSGAAITALLCPRAYVCIAPTKLLYQGESCQITESSMRE